jgi:hypothetical protein
MKITKYAFGHIEIDGAQYNSDLIIFPEKVMANWRRNSGHSLTMEDLKEVVKYRPELLVIGQGAFGVMKIQRGLIEKLQELGIKVLAANTREAADIYNEESKSHKRIVGVFHLTC